MPESPLAVIPPVFVGFSLAAAFIKHSPSCSLVQAAEDSPGGCWPCGPAAVGYGFYDGVNTARWYRVLFGNPHRVMPISHKFGLDRDFPINCYSYA